MRRQVCHGGGCRNLATVANHFASHSDAAVTRSHVHLWCNDCAANVVFSCAQSTLYSFDRYDPIVDVTPGSELNIALEVAFHVLAGAV